MTMRKLICFIGFSLTTIALAAADTEPAGVPGVMALVGAALMLVGGIRKISEEEIDAEEIIDRWDSDHIARVVEFQKREDRRRRGK